MATITLFPSVITTTRTWGNPDNAKTDDGINATTNGTTNNDHDLIGTGFDLSSIPEGSSITSVAAEVKYYVSRSRNWTGTLGVTRGGVEDEAHGITTSDAPTSYEVWRNLNLGVWTLEELQTIGVLFRVRKETVLSVTWYVDYLALVVDYTPPLTVKPVITITDCDRTKISRVSGFSRAIVTFHSDTALSEWEARANGGAGHGIGLLVGSGGALMADTSATFDVDDDELTLGDKEYTVTVYGKSAGGVWSG